MPGLGKSIALNCCIPEKEVPAAVLAAFQKAYPEALMKAFARENEDGKTYYEIESIDGGRARDVLYLADGSVVESEVGVSEAELPATVKATLEKRHPRRQMVKAEKTIRGSTITYEVNLKTGKDKYELVIEPGGRVVREKRIAGRKEKGEQHDS
jgi:hypothetical protein